MVKVRQLRYRVDISAVPCKVLEWLQQPDYIDTKNGKVYAVYTIEVFDVPVLF